MGWTKLLGAALLTVCAAGAACTSSGAGDDQEPAHERACGPDPSDRPFGKRTKAFLGSIAALPQSVADEFSERGENLGEEWDRIVAARALEFERTGDHLANFGPALGEEFSVRGSRLADSCGRIGSRIGDDSRCFFARAWHSLKIVE